MWPWSRIRELERENAELAEYLLDESRAYNTADRLVRYLRSDNDRLRTQLRQLLPGDAHERRT